MKVATLGPNAFALTVVWTQDNADGAAQNGVAVLDDCKD